MGGHSIWISIVRALDNLEGRGVDLKSFCNRKVGNGHNTRFWLDKWMGDCPLKERFHRIFALDTNSQAMVVDRNSEEKLRFLRPLRVTAGIRSSQWEGLLSELQRFPFSETRDKMVWDLDISGTYVVASARHFMDSFFLAFTDTHTRWNNLVPIKLNILIWRIGWDKIPTRLNLRDKGVDLDSVLCPVCSDIGESTEHLFVGCPLLAPLWRRISLWWEIDLPPLLSVHNLITWADGAPWKPVYRQLFDAVVISTFWTVWGYRNNLIFRKEKPKRDVIFDDIVSNSFFWISNRKKNCNICWDRWLCCPKLAIL